MSSSGMIVLYIILKDPAISCGPFRPAIFHGFDLREFDGRAFVRCSLAGMRACLETREYVSIPQVINCEDAMTNRAWIRKPECVNDGV